jgi:phytoene dehydrogenase-like protein
VTQVIVKGGRAVGVALENGDEVHARAVLSSADPFVTFLKLVDAKYLPDDLLHSVKKFRTRGSSGKVNIALSELPQFTALPGEGALHRGAISISPSIDYIERAYDDAKYGRFARQPYVDMIIPSMIDPDMAPPGKHVMSCFVQYAPYDIEGGWDDAKREAFGDTVISTIERYAPNIRRAIIGKQVITPADTERIAGITGAISSTASCCCTSSSSCAPPRAGRVSARRCAGITWRARARIPVAASWAHRVSSPQNLH